MSEHPAPRSCQDTTGRVRFPKAVSTEALWPLPSRGQMLCPGGIHYDTGEWDGDSPDTYPTPAKWQLG